MKDKKINERTVFRYFFYLELLVVISFGIITFQKALPSQLYLPMGEDINYQFSVPVTVVLKEESKAVFETLQGKNQVDYEAQPVSYHVTCKLFGIFPVKEVAVTLVERETVQTSGVPVGIYARTQGVLIIGTGNVTMQDGTSGSPSLNLVSGGDYIVSVNGVPIRDKSELIQQVAGCEGKTEILGLIRKDSYIEVAVSPVLSEDGTYMLGIWVRDDLAGVGTLTYVKEDGSYGALGHAISDGDTGSMIRMEEGWIYETSIVGIRKGKSGNPGELAGIINYGDEYRLGSISKNTTVGIQGNFLTSVDGIVEDAYSVGYKQEIVPGEAYLLSAFTGEIKAYRISIESVDYSGADENKGILFSVTDPALLATTGGVVQGMSGSPIIQNDKFVGAVTHVFVNDPTKGYGIFAETMLGQE